MNDRNALVQAAFGGKVGLVNQMLKAGADANAVDEKGLTALRAAIAGQRYFCVETLIRHGADLSRIDHGHTPLAFAVDAAIDVTIQSGSRAAVPTDIIRLLVAAGADIEAGLKTARNYQCAAVIELLEAAARAR